jgi:DNA-binding MarR family transcriptional regulator
MSNDFSKDPQHLHGDEFEALARTAVERFAPTSDLESMGVIMNLLRMANRLQQDFETNVHRPAGLSFAAFRVLFTIESVGPINPVALARLSSVSPASMSTVLNTLEAKGLAARRKGVAQDGRVVLVELTDAGEEVLATLWERNHEREVVWASALTPRERQTMARLLHKMLAFHPHLGSDTTTANGNE